jgi:nucleoside-diphosphate-sugar epimerase
VKVLVTGAAGFLGRGLVIPFQGKSDLRLMDVADWDTPHEKVVGSVADLDTVLRAAEGVDALVIAHMAPQGKVSYGTPTLPYDVNVKGTANLFFAAAQLGIKRVALVSSGGAVGNVYFAGGYLSRDLPFGAKGMYSHTKVLQETIARMYHQEFGIGVAILRPGYITDMDLRQDKYGRVLEECNWQFADRRDIGEIARRALLLPDLGCEIFWTLSTPMGAKHADMEYVYKRLDWKPQYDFSNLKQDPR